MNETSAPPEIETRKPPHFVQTDRASHEEWARLSIRKPTAAGVLHFLAANIGKNNAVIVSQNTIAKALSVTDRSIRSAVNDLAAGNWIEVVKLGAGRECAYVLNDRVAWIERRDKLRYSKFTAEVIADFADQPERYVSDAPLRKLPRKGERQLAHGDSLPPVSQPFLRGMEPDLPEIQDD